MSISIIGGDSRIVELAKILKKDRHEIKIYGLEKNVELSNYNNVNSLEEALNSDVIVTPIPLSKDGKNFNNGFTDKKIEIKKFFELVKNKKIITGNITDEIKNCIKFENNNQIIDILEYEELTILNSIPTAEGAIQIAMKKSKITLHGSNCLVLGFGRIGKILSKMLLGIGANVYCEARKQLDIAWIKSYGYNAIHLNELNKNLEKFDFIFNTIPYLILDKNNLKLVKKDCLLIDLASKPGGIDFAEADNLYLKNEWALALPGKVAPKTAANYIYEVIISLKNII